MSLEVLFMLALIVATIVAFALELLPIEVTALGLLGVLLLTGIVSPEEAFSGFSNKAVITIGSLFVLSYALSKTGVIEMAAEHLSRWTQHRRWMGIGLLLSMVGLLSGFLNNTAMVALFMPLAINLCSRFDLSPSKVLIPLSYVAIAGGTLTLVGTSTNLLVSSIIEAEGQRPLGMFEFTTLGSTFLGIALVYALFFACRVLPDRVKAGPLTRKYHMGPYLTEVRVIAGSKLEGRSCREASLNERYGTTVLEVLRGRRRYIESIGTMPLALDDILIVQGSVEDLLSSYIANYRAGKGIPARTKAVSICVLWITLAVSALMVQIWWIWLILGAVAVGVPLFILSLPTLLRE